MCYEDVRDVFVSRKESVFPMQTHLDMVNNYHQLTPPKTYDYQTAFDIKPKKVFYNVDLDMN